MDDKTKIEHGKSKHNLFIKLEPEIENEIPITEKIPAPPEEEPDAALNTGLPLLNGFTVENCQLQVAHKKSEPRTA